jgi:predicted phosphodiesterase
MRLGLLADIHEVVPQLRAAVAALSDRQVDSFIVLGDFSKRASALRKRSPS